MGLKTMAPYKVELTKYLYPKMPVLSEIDIKYFNEDDKPVWTDGGNWNLFEVSTQYPENRKLIQSLYGIEGIKFTTLPGETHSTPYLPVLFIQAEYTSKFKLPVFEFKNIPVVKLYHQDYRLVTLSAKDAKTYMETSCIFSDKEKNIFNTTFLDSMFYDSFYMIRYYK